MAPYVGAPEIKARRLVLTVEYHGQIGNPRSIRLLSGSKKRATLLPAVESFAQQSGTPISVRVLDGLHDRYLFIDRTDCHLSGASFKDGAKNSPAILAKITDPFQAMWDTYERQWERGEIVLAR